MAQYQELPPGHKKQLGYCEQCVFCEAEELHYVIVKKRSGSLVGYHIVCKQCHFRGPRRDTLFFAVEAYRQFCAKFNDRLKAQYQSGIVHGKESGNEILCRVRDFAELLQQSLEVQDGTES